MSMDNFGKPVPHERVTAGERALREMLPKVSTGDRLSIIKMFVDKIERDEPAVLLSARPPEPINRLDLTGRYRLLAHLMAEPAPSEEKDPPKRRSSIRGSKLP